MRADPALVYHLVSLHANSLHPQVFFWAPLMKWCLVAAGVKDLSRPADKLSVSQNVALACTGMIWVRYSLVITPVNYSLAAVNFFVGTTGIAQLYRIWE